MLHKKFNIRLNQQSHKYVNNSIKQLISILVFLPDLRHILFLAGSFLNSLPIPCKSYLTPLQPNNRINPWLLPVTSGGLLICYFFPKTGKHIFCILPSLFLSTPAGQGYKPRPATVSQRSLAKLCSFLYIMVTS